MEDLVVGRMTLTEVDKDGEVEIEIESFDSEYSPSVYINKEQSMTVILHLMRQYNLSTADLCEQ